jgi:hypothetical protein
VKREEREYARALHQDLGERAFPEGFRSVLPPFNNWVREVQAIQAELHPGGRATLTREGSPDVVVHWEMVLGGRGGRQRFLALTSLHIDPPPGGRLSVHGLDLVLSCYYAALALALDREGEPVPDTAPLPAPGKAVSIDHYRRLNAEYDELVKAAHPKPLVELARRYTERLGRPVPVGTVKSWRSRGSKYLKGT